MGDLLARDWYVAWSYVVMSSTLHTAIGKQGLETRVWRAGIVYFVHLPCFPWFRHTAVLWLYVRAHDLILIIQPFS